MSILENLEVHRSVRPCKVRATIQKLEGRDQELLKQYIGDEEYWSDYQLEKALYSVGIRLSDTMIRRHRSKQCSCEEYYAGKH